LLNYKKIRRKERNSPFWLKENSNHPTHLVLAQPINKHEELQMTLPTLRPMALTIETDAIFPVDTMRERVSIVHSGKTKVFFPLDGLQMPTRCRK